MSLTSLALRFAAPAPKLERFDRFLFIGPHPDDVEIGAGATAAKLRALGKSVSLLICLDGRFGLENAPPGTTPEQLIAIRKRESLAAAAALGLDEPIFLGLSDGAQYTREELTRGIARVIGETQPEVIFAPDPFVASECHADHLAVGEAARELAFFAPYPEIMAAYGARSAPVRALAFYMTARPNRFVPSGPYPEKQLRAIRCHESQFPEGSEALRSVELYLKLRAADFGLRCLRGRAEGFRVLGQTQMHCLPEAGL
ncbi:MAG: PIG-L family deacetylase [Oscillospiraceae bacterium]|nr:PIG-L family deacetylase [Oscillospiraceae bacterium]